MCRSIKTLRHRSEIASQDEIRAAALQFVRKVSGFHRPSQRNVDVFEQAVDEVAAAADRLLRTLVLPAAS
jgi:hypothetical protein